LATDQEVSGFGRLSVENEKGESVFFCFLGAEREGRCFVGSLCVAELRRQQKGGESLVVPNNCRLFSFRAFWNLSLFIPFMFLCGGGVDDVLWLLFVSFVPYFTTTKNERKLKNESRDRRQEAEHIQEKCLLNTDGTLRYTQFAQKTILLVLRGTLQTRRFQVSQTEIRNRSAVRRQPAFRSPLGSNR